MFSPPTPSKCTRSRSTSIPPCWGSTFRADDKLLESSWVPAARTAGSNGYYIRCPIHVVRELLDLEAVDWWNICHRLELRFPSPRCESPPKLLVLGIVLIKLGSGECVPLVRINKDVGVHVVGANNALVGDPIRREDVLRHGFHQSISFLNHHFDIQEETHSARLGHGCVLRACDLPRGLLGHEDIRFHRVEPSRDQTHH